MRCAVTVVLFAALGAAGAAGQDNPNEKKADGPPSDNVLIAQCGGKVKAVFAQFGPPSQLTATRQNEAKNDLVLMYYSDGYGFYAQGREIRGVNFFAEWKGTVMGIKIGDTRPQVDKVLKGRFKADADNDYLVPLKDLDAEAAVIFTKEHKVFKVQVYPK